MKTPQLGRKYATRRDSSAVNLAIGAKTIKRPDPWTWARDQVKKHGFATVATK